MMGVSSIDKNICQNGQAKVLVPCKTSSKTISANLFEKVKNFACGIRMPCLVPSFAYA